MYPVYNVMIGGDTELLGTLVRFDDAKTFVKAYMEREVAGNCAGVELHTGNGEYILYEADGSISRWDKQGNQIA